MNYFDKRDSLNIDKINGMLKNCLPPFCEEYFIGIEPRTTTLTRLNYAYDLKLFFFYLTTSVHSFQNKTSDDITLDDIENLSPFDIEKYLSWLGKYTDKNGCIVANKESGKKRKLSSLRAMIKYFCKKQLLNFDPTISVETPKLRSKDIVRLDTNEITQLIDTVENRSGMSQRQQKYLENTQIRDFAIVSLLLSTGIRVSELVGINRDDVDYENFSFVVTRKGGAKVILYYPEEIAGALSDYNSLRNSLAEKAPNEEALFLSLQNKRIGTRSVENLVNKYSKIAAPLKNISPHKLRSTFGTELYRKTKDIYVVADVLGHKDVNTTKKHYAAITDDIRKQASRKVSIYSIDDEDNNED